MNKTLETLKAKSIRDEGIGAEDAVALARIGKEKPFLLMAAASDIREHFKGRRINLCGIINAKSGRCTEDCKFCAQSVHYVTDAPVYPLVSSDEILDQAKRAVRDGAHMFGIITSGTRIDEGREWDEIVSAVAKMRAAGIRPCASLGMIDREKAAQLKDAGLYRYHHNLETAGSFFHEICSTHDYQEDIDTVLAAREAGLAVCSGGIIGLGESMEQRIELAITLKELKVDSVPVNILNPRPGTPLSRTAALHPLEILTTISLFRFILPGKDIKLCGGKEANLRQLLPLGIVAGANSLMTGNYLTTSGRETALDLEMIRDLGLSAVLEEH